MAEVPHILHQFLSGGGIDLRLVRLQAQRAHVVHEFFQRIDVHGVARQLGLNIRGQHKIRHRGKRLRQRRADVFQPAYGGILLFKNTRKFFVRFLGNCFQHMVYYAPLGVFEQRRKRINILEAFAYFFVRRVKAALARGAGQRVKCFRRVDVPRVRSAAGQARIMALAHGKSHFVLLQRHAVF